jgi:hypothetical protein
VKAQVDGRGFPGQRVEHDLGLAKTTLEPPAMLQALPVGQMASLPILGLSCYCVADSFCCVVRMGRYQEQQAQQV